MRRREDAICLRTTDYSETSQVAHFLTPGSGQVRVIAKGVKRKKSSAGGALDLFSEGELVFVPGSPGKLGTLVEFSETVSHSPLRKEASRLNAALYMLELARELIAESDPHPAVFELLHNGLVRLGQADAPIPAVLAYYQWRLLRHVGLMGEMTDCVSCGRAVAGGGGQRGREIFFSSTLGGLLCDTCEGGEVEKRRISGEALAGLRVLAEARPGRKAALPDGQALEVNRLLAYHISRQIGKPLRMAPHAIGPK